jgi:hypothetical protein
MPLFAARGFLRLLEPHRFVLSWEDPRTYELCFVRTASIPELWQRVRFRGGRNRTTGEEGIAPWIGVSVIRGRAGVPAHGLWGEAPLVDPDENLRCDVVASSRAEAAIVEREVSERLVPALDDAERRNGAELELRTRNVRAAVARYQASLAAYATLTEIERALEPKADPVLLAHADRLADATACGLVPGGVSTYRAAALALLVLRPELEPDQAPFEGIENVWTCGRHFDSRVQLLVDRLLDPARARGPIGLL